MVIESLRTDDNGNETTIQLGGNDFFGDEILKGGSDKNYLSTVTATSKVTCWVLQKGDAKRFIGSKRKHDTNMA